VFVTRRPDRDEEGATLVVLSLVLIVLMGFAAFGVDAAAALAQRRQNQGSVDTGDLAGAQFTASRMFAAAVAAAEREVIRITYESLEPDGAFTAWEDEWDDCTDPDRPASFSVTGTSDCISFTVNLERMRVHLPDIDVETSFGKVLGRDFIATTASAIVASGQSSDAMILPFGIPGIAAGDFHVCLKTGPDPASMEPCDGPETGNFGFLDITEFGNIELGSFKACTGQTTSRLVRNIARGVDHPIGTAPSAGAFPWHDRVLCPDGNLNSRPYTLETEPGNGKGAALDDGLVDGDGAGIPGRLNRGSNTIVIADERIDNTPLWDYLNGNGEAFCGTVDDHLEMIDCLEGWSSADGVLFSEDIEGAIRFAWAPLFWDATLGTGNTDHNVRRFNPVWLQTTFWECNPGGCRRIHNPDEPQGGTGGNNGDDIDAVTAIQIPLGALPESLTVEAPGTPGGVAYTLFE
jgi:hypothetical protein